MTLETINTVRIVGVAVVASLFLSACGESDLEQLQFDEIEAAQAMSSGETVVPTEVGQANGDSETPTVEPTAPTDDMTDVEKLLPDYTLVFSDEFNGTTLDENKWNTQLQWGPDLIVNDEEQYYVDIRNASDFGYDPFSFDGSAITISADRTPADLLSSAKDQSYLSGALTSLGFFDVSYGYIEIRAKLPTGKGYWPGFWMLGTEFIDKKPQLYIMENRGDNTSVVYHRYNYSNENDQFVYSDLLQSSGQDFSSDFHTFGVEWSEGQLTYYVDGMSQHTITNENVASQKMYFILNLAVGGWFPEAPDDTTGFPGSFTIDYIRAYQKQ